MFILTPLELWHLFLWFKTQDSFYTFLNNKTKYFSSFEVLKIQANIMMVFVSDFHVKSLRVSNFNVTRRLCQISLILAFELCFNIEHILSKKTMFSVNKYSLNWFTKIRTLATRFLNLVSVSWRQVYTSKGNIFKYF